MLISSDHPPYLTRHRAETIASRVRMVAAAFSVLTLAWIALDRLALPWPSWGWLAGLRLLAAGAFAALAVAAHQGVTLRRAFILLAAMLSLPLSLFLASQAVFADVTLGGAAAVDSRLYAALPVIIIAGLGVFPLTVAEGLAFAVPVILAATFGPMLTSGFDWVNQLATLWVLGLILGVFLLQSMIQLHYMINLLRRASHDPLTGTFTRHSGNEIVEAQFRLSCRQNTPFAVAFVDLDNFKSVNDAHGHEAGDWVLKNAVANLARLLRRSDIVIRWGGEEFVVLLGNATGEGQRIAMERIVEEWLGTRPDGLPVTASIGVAERISDGAQDWPALIELADTRMYQAKVSGKARCVMGGGAVLASDARLPPASR
ncbi:diguanylate cyclase [Magnetospirillum sp. SS-4]|uniref:GGDEF domain-containing protein n=1 Tax=Magnetospirillum sp. SS-4 TaxID=2681465 RepID=UPI00157315AE|nr:GGDEF domain-containing protein [Magnetospirillum sp. SS-4]